MPQSLFKVCAHMVWSTRSRRRFLHEGVRPGLHSYVAGILRKMGCDAINVGGTGDHIHIVCCLSKTEPPVRLIQAAKGRSSGFAKTLGPDLHEFAWQRGYGIFSVAPHDFDAAVDYVEAQTEHHRTRTFREEFMRFVRQYDLPYDERYMWE